MNLLLEWGLKFTHLKEKIKTIQPNIPLDYYQLVDFVQWLEKLLKTKIIKK